MTDRQRKAFWFSLILTGAGQLYLGEKKKGYLFLLLSFLGILVSCAGVFITYSTLLGIAGFMVSHDKLFFPLGALLFIGGFFIIIFSGLRSLRDITVKDRK